MADILVDVWLYGDPARYGGKADQGSFANRKVRLSEGRTIRDLLEHLHLPTEERGIAFINGELRAMPNMQLDFDHLLNQNDRGAFFDLHSLWPFQYRFGIKMANEMPRPCGRAKTTGCIMHINRNGPGIAFGSHSVGTEMNKTMQQVI